MLDEKKVRMMIRLSNFEQERGKEDIRRVEYYKGDYVRLQVLKTIIRVTFAVLMGIALIVMYRLDYFVSNALKIHWVALATTSLLFYVLVVMLFSAITVSVASLRYKESKNRVRVYYDTLNDLAEYYDNEEGEVKDK